jgi:hypothetical protein
MGDVPIGQDEAGERTLAQLEGEHNYEGHIGHQKHFINHDISSSKQKL